MRDQLYALTFSTEKDFTGSDRGEVITCRLRSCTDLWDAHLGLSILPTQYIDSDWRILRGIRRTYVSM